MSRVVVANESVVEAISRAYNALVAVKDGRSVRQVETPRWLPDGMPVSSVKQLAALMDVSERSAAAYALDAEHSSPELLQDAKSVVMGQPGLKPKRQGLKPIKRPKLSVRKRCVIRHAVGRTNGKR